jgi:hypothetical protein
MVTVIQDSEFKDLKDNQVTHHDLVAIPISLLEET